MFKNRFYLIIFALVLALILESCGTMQTSSYKAKPAYNKKTGYSIVYKQRYDVPIEVNEAVVDQIDYFTGRGRRYFERYYKRSGKYIPMMRQVLKEHGIPQDLVYLAMIESGFSVKARSRARAMGPWQFMHFTGRVNGLKIDTWVDERCDPVKSTYAAARHLRDLYRDFGDWYLALGAYNAGAGKISNAIRRYHTRNFWELSAPGNSYLRPETRQYVPKFIAAVLIAKNPNDFGFGDIDKDMPLAYDEVSIDSQTEIKVIANLARTSVSEIEDLNSELRRWATPPVSSYKVKVPLGRGDEFKTKYASLPKSERVTVAYHIVKSGEALSKIARRYGVSTEMLVAANKIRNARSIKANQRLIIPTHGSLKLAHGVVEEQTSEKKEVVADVGSEEVIYKVRYGDSLWEIAQKFDVGVNDIKRWNRITNHRNLNAGRKIKIYKREDIPVVEETENLIASSSNAGSKKTAEREHQLRQTNNIRHKVKWGESLWTISRKYGVSMDDIVAWNSLKSSKSIKTGNTLVINPITPKIQPTTQQTSIVSNAARTKALQVQTFEPQKTDMLAHGSQAASNNISTVEMPPKVVENTNKNYHTVRRGDSLWTISKKYNVSIAELKSWNGISNASQIKPGKKLIVYSTGLANLKRTNALPTSSTVAETGIGMVVHTVKPGDTLWEIARKYNVPAAQIEDLNGKKKHIKPGDRLKIRPKFANES